MQNEARADVWKVWYYAIASVLLGTWISPLLYNAGKALAEVSAQKTTNGPIEWLAGICRSADFPHYYAAALLLAGLLLFLPWMEWIHAKRGESPASRVGPWRIRLPEGAKMGLRGQPLRRNPRGLWQTCAGFLLVAGFLLSMGVALAPAGFFTLHAPGSGLATHALRALASGLALACLMEVFFRGIVTGIFLRAMRQSVAIGMSAAFFAMVLSMLPSSGVNVADPEAPGIGFELLRRILGQWADWRMVFGNFLPLLALGFVLAYARWRTASLWMPIGLHTGWLFSKGMLASLLTPTGSPEPGISMSPGNLLQNGIVPLAGILLVGVLAHYLTDQPEDEHGAGI